MGSKLKYLLEKAANMSGPSRVFGRMFRSMAAKSRVISETSVVKKVQSRVPGAKTTVANDMFSNVEQRTGNCVASTGAYAVKSPGMKLKSQNLSAWLRVGKLKFSNWRPMSFVDLRKLRDSAERRPTAELTFDEMFIIEWVPVFPAGTTRQQRRDEFYIPSAWHVLLTGVLPIRQMKREAELFLALLLAFARQLLVANERLVRPFVPWQFRLLSQGRSSAFSPRPPPVPAA
ncbi:MAG: hypothetical protein IPH60_08710 [Flavobacteriales bacterium]|nr:hypothetical protein [Flavobacteriales bacterium]